MNDVFLHDPTRVYLKFSGSYTECKSYIDLHKAELKKWGQYFTIRDFDFTCLYRFGSQLLQM